MANLTDDRTVSCIVCQSKDVRRFLYIEKVPIFCNVQWLDRQQALDAAVGDIALGFCNECGHIFNCKFDPHNVEYLGAYENSLHFSPHFQEYAQRLVETLINKYDLINKTIIEIGCGKGEFISMLCESGQNIGYGFDTSYEEERTARVSSSSVTFVKDFYDQRHSNLKPDFVCCRHVLEHIQQPVHFLQSIRAAIGEVSQVAVYFEVPNALYSIDDMGIWDFIYEHCSYFCTESANRTFDEAGFRVLNTRTDFGSQFLCIEASPNKKSSGYTAPKDRLHELAKTVELFEHRYIEKVDYWNKTLMNAATEGKRGAIWGSGSKGVTFLNCIENSNAIDVVVDLNPNKHGMFVGGTGHEIVSPKDLHTNPPDYVIVMNSAYQTEIELMLSDMNIQASVECA